LCIDLVLAIDSISGMMSRLAKRELSKGSFVMSLFDQVRLPDSLSVARE